MASRRRLHAPQRLGQATDTVNDSLALQQRVAHDEAGGPRLPGALEERTDGIDTHAKPAGFPDQRRLRRGRQGWNPHHQMKSAGQPLQFNPAGQMRLKGFDQRALPRKRPTSEDCVIAIAVPP